METNGTAAGCPEAATDAPCSIAGTGADPAGAPVVASAGDHLAEWRWREAQRRRAVLVQVAQGLREGLRLGWVSKELRVPVGTLWQWLSLARRGKESVGAAELCRRLLAGPTEALAPGTSPGRPCAWGMLLEVEGVKAKLDMLYLATMGASSDYMGHGRRTCKVATALELFADEPECPVELGARLRRGYQPAAFVRHLRRITPEMEARLRGPKHFQLHGLRSRRDLTVGLPDGRVAELRAGCLVEFDDMSANQPFHVERPDGSVILSRQGLYARDLVSGRWLAVELVARPREAYRAEDILRFIRRLMQINGKFDVLRLEKGVWHSRMIRGWKVGDVIEEPYERPAMSDKEVANLKDGLEAIGIHIDYARSAHHKVIESGFRYFQDILAGKTTEYINIGHHAGEYEHGAKQLRRARAESRHPRDLGFASIDALAERIERAFAFINARKPNDETSADEIWERDLAARPLPPLTERDLAAFMPERRVSTIVGGLVTLKVDGQPHDFRADLFAELGTGYQVYCLFDPSEPTAGAAVYNRDTTSANHKGYADGDFICWAPWEMPGTQIDLDAVRGLTAMTVEERYGARAGEVLISDGYARRRRQAKYVRTRFVGMPRPGQPTVKASRAADGAGRVVKIESGETTESGAPARAKAGRRSPLAPPTEQEWESDDRWARLAEFAKKQE